MIKLFHNSVLQTCKEFNLRTKDNWAVAMFNVKTICFSPDIAKMRVLTYYNHTLSVIYDAAVRTNNCVLGKNTQRVVAYRYLNNTLFKNI